MFKELCFLKEISVYLNRQRTLELIKSLADCNKQCYVNYRCNSLDLHYNEAEEYSFPDKALNKGSVTVSYLTGSKLSVTVENRKTSIRLQGYNDDEHHYTYRYRRAIGNLWVLTCKNVPLKILKFLESHVDEVFEEKVRELIVKEEEEKIKKRIAEMKVLLLQKVK